MRLKNVPVFLLLICNDALIYNRNNRNCVSRNVCSPRRQRDVRDGFRAATSYFAHRHNRVPAAASRFPSARSWLFAFPFGIARIGSRAR